MLPFSSFVESRPTYSYTLREFRWADVWLFEENRDRVLNWVNVGLPLFGRARLLRSSPRVIVWPSPLRGFKLEHLAKTHQFMNSFSKRSNVVVGQFQALGKLQRQEAIRKRNDI